MQATAAIEALLSRLAACVDDVVERARSGAELREGEAEGMCAALEELLAHRFKRRQFLLFSVHPWSLAEHAEALSSAAAVRIGVARQTGSTDSARLRAWLYLLLNRRELAAEVDALLTPELCSLMYTRGAALLGSAERDRLVRTLKPLAALRFRLGASAGLCLPEQPSGSLEARDGCANTTATTTHRPTTHPPTTHHPPPTTHRPTPFVVTPTLLPAGRTRACLLRRAPPTSPPPTRPSPPPPPPQSRAQRLRRMPTTWAIRRWRERHCSLMRRAARPRMRDTQRFGGSLSLALPRSPLSPPCYALARSRSRSLAPLVLDIVHCARLTCDM